MDRITLALPFARTILMLVAILLGTVMFLGSQARAQDDWPTRSIRIIVPFNPGGASDVSARPLANVMEKYLGVPVVIENRGGAGGAVGTEYFAGCVRTAIRRRSA